MHGFGRTPACSPALQACSPIYPSLQPYQAHGFDRPQRGGAMHRREEEARCPFPSYHPSRMHRREEEARHRPPTGP